MSPVLEDEREQIRLAIRAGAGGPDFDMEDAPVLRGASLAPPLDEALRTLQESLHGRYDKANKAAIRLQRNHRRLVWSSALCGALALVLEVILLRFHGVHGKATEILGWAKLIAVLGAIVAVVFGLAARVLFRWLQERHRAERYRLLKFNMLTECSLWDGSIDRWRATLQREIAAIDAMDYRVVRAWADRDRPSDLPRDLEHCAIGDDEARALASYYRAKRVAVQREFFTSQVHAYEGRDRRLRWIPPRLFFLGVGLALLYSLIGHWQNWSWIVAALAVCAPILGAAVRTYRLAFEFARSASLYRAKADYLRDIEAEFDTVIDSRPADVVQMMWKCEKYLEREHREWLWLMFETEWFG